MQQEIELLLLTVDKEFFTSKYSKLSVVIPIKNFETHRERITSWMTLEVLDKLTVVLVHDKRVNETSKELIDFVESLSHQNLILMSGHFNSPGKARNIGLNFLSETPGWIAFWDCDDIPNVTRFLEMITLADRDEKKFTVGSFVVRDSKSNDLIESHPILNSRLVHLGGVVGIWRWAFKSESIKGIEFQEFSMGEDQDYLFDLDPKSIDVFFYGKCVYTYFKGNYGQLTSNPNRVKEISLSYKYIMKKAQSRKISLFQIQILRRQFFTTLKHGDFKLRISAILTSIKFFPQIAAALFYNLWNKIE